MNLPSATNTTSFLFAFTMIVWIPIQNYYHNFFTVILTLVSALTGFIIFLVGTGESKCKKMNSESLIRILFALSGIVCGIPISILLDRLLNV